MDLQLIDRGGGVFWEGAGKYDRAWNNHLELTVDKGTRVESLVASSVDVPPQKVLAAAEAAVAAPLDAEKSKEEL